MFRSGSKLEKTDPGPKLWSSLTRGGSCCLWLSRMNSSRNFKRQGCGSGWSRPGFRSRSDLRDKTGSGSWSNRQEKLDQVSSPTPEKQPGSGLLVFTSINTLLYVYLILVHKYCKNCSIWREFLSRFSNRIRLFFENRDTDPTKRPNSDPCFKDNQARLFLDLCESFLRTMALNRIIQNKRKSCIEYLNFNTTSLLEVVELPPYGIWYIIFEP